MNAPTATTKLSYKELQTALKSYKEQGLTGIKLNSKQEALEQEYARLTAKEETAVKEQGNTSNDSYPFCSNTVKVENKPAVEETKAVNEQVFSTKVIRAMDNKYAPSWLCKPYTVYVIDGIEYLPYELEMQLKGQVCELPAAVNQRKLQANLPPRLQVAARKDRVSNARQPQPLINPAKDKPKVKCEYSKEPASPYFIDTAKAAKYSKSLGDVELQAARNLEDGIKYASSATKRVVGAVIDFGKGFHARQVERASKAAA